MRERVRERAREVVLASTSRYRRELLGRIFPSVRCVAPDVDESPLPGEEPEAIVRRLARAKAERVAARCPDTIVVGSDQLAAVGQDVLGKPGSRERACEQLRALSGQDVRFLTAVAVIDATTGEVHEALDVTEVRFRALADTEIDAYLAREQPFNCAGSFKSEALGIALFERIRSDDPTALVGLPLIATCRLLRQLGVDPLAPP